MSTFRDRLAEVARPAIVFPDVDFGASRLADAILAMPEMEWLRQQAQQGQSGFDSMPDCLGEWLWGRR